MNRTTLALVMMEAAITPNLQRPKKQNSGIARFSRATAAVYFLLLGCVAWHLANNFSYSMDMLGYMGNAAIIQNADIVKAHAAVYHEVLENIPAASRNHLLGVDPLIPAEQSNSARDRNINPYHAAEYLPCYAIRPLFIELLSLVHRAGIGLVHGLILITLSSYFGLGILLLVWLRRYVGPGLGEAYSLLLMISPPIMTLGRYGTADCFAALIALLGLYFILERRFWAAGLAILLISVYARTDDILIVLPTVAYFWATKQMKTTYAFTIAALGIASVLFINHFAGDYGVGMLYYRGFGGVPIAPAEVSVHVTSLEYLHGLRSGLTKLLGGFPLVFLLLGAVSLGASRRRVPRELGLITALFACAHFLIFPIPEDRYLALFYFGMGIMGISCVAIREQTADVEPLSRQPYVMKQSA